MNSDQRNLLPPVPPLYSNTDSSTASSQQAQISRPSFSTTAMQSMPYGTATQSYSHLPLNPIPGPPYHKIAEPVRQTSNTSSSLYSQQYQQESFPQQPYASSAQSYSTQQQFYSPPQSGYPQQSYTNPVPSMSQQFMPQPLPYQQHSPQPPAKSSTQTQFEKFDSKMSDQDQTQTQVPSQPEPDSSKTANQSQQLQQTDSTAEPQPIMQASEDNAISTSPTVPDTTQQTVTDDASASRVPAVAEMALDLADDVNPSSPEIKLKIKKTFTNSGKAKLTSSLLSGKSEDEGSTKDGDDDSSSSTQDSLSTSEIGQPSPVGLKPMTLAEKKQNVKAGRAVGGVVKTVAAPIGGSRIPPGYLDEKPCEWLVGDLVWSKVSGHPWWPCMVAYDPNLGIYTRMKGSVGKNYRMYHVQFFGEVPERGWVSGSSMRKFTGRSQYEELVQEMVSKVKKSERTRLAAKLAVKSSRQKAWDIAVIECQRALPMSRHERKLNFTFKYELPKGVMGAVQAEQIDVVSLGDSPKMKAKRAYKKLQDDEAAATNTIPSIAMPPSGVDNQATSSSAEKSAVECAAASEIPKQKRKYRRRKKDGEGENPSDSESPKLKRKRGRKTAQFLLFVEKRQFEIMAENPALKKAEVYLSLEEEWDHIPEAEKAKYMPEPKPSPPRRKDPNASPGKRGRKSDQFLAFVEAQKPELIKDNPSMSKRDIFVAIEKKWEQLSEEEKLKYLKKGATPPGEKKVRKRKILESTSTGEMPVKRSRRETKPSKKLQEADLDNLGFSPKSLKASRKVEDSTKELTEVKPPQQAPTSTSGKPSKPPTQVPAGSDVVKSKRGRKPKHLANGGTTKEKVKKPSITEMSQDFADMQEDDDLTLDTDLITSAIQSAGDIAARFGSSNGASSNASGNESPFLPPFPGFST